MNRLFYQYLINDVTIVNKTICIFFFIALGPKQANLLAGYALTFMIFMKYF